MEIRAGVVPDRVVVVVAAFNEASAISAVVEALLSARTQVVVVDDGSEDDTAAVAATAGATVLRHEVNLGQGAALATGLRFATERLDPKVVVTFDADGQHRTEDLALLIAPILHDTADVTLGSRFLPGGQAEGIPRSRRALLQMAARGGARRGLRLTDAHNGLRAFSPAAARVVANGLTQPRMAHASELITLVAAAGLRITEAPVTVKYTPYSLAKGQRLRHAVSVLWDLVATRLLRS